MDERLRRQLRLADRRLSAVRREHVAAVAWLGLALAALALVALARVGAGRGWRTADVALGIAAAAAVVLGARALAGGRRRDPREIARRIERSRGDLDSALLAAVELEPDLPGGRYGYLATRLVDDLLADARRRPWTAALAPSRRLRAARLAHAGAAVAFLAAVVALLGPGRARGPGAGTAGLGPGPVTDGVRVQPGDLEIERGESVLVTAAFPRDALPAGAEVVTEAAGELARAPMTKSLDDPVFAGRLTAVERDLEYRVEWPGGGSPAYRITVFDRPALERADVVLRYPAYAGLEDRRVHDTRRVTAPEGTEVTLVCTLNVAVASARLVERGGGFTLDLSPTEPRTVEGAWTLTRALRLELELTDAAGRDAAERASFVFHVTDNRRPELSPLAARDVRVSPVEELCLGVRASDDFALLRYGLSYRVAGGSGAEIVLGGGGEREAEGEHVVPFEELGARAGQLLAYHYWAEDRGTDGEPRRTASDLFFAEVRPFEEVFREAESPPMGAEPPSEPGAEGEPGAGGAAQLADLQREVVIATWNAIRRHAGREGELAADARVVREAQRDARERLAALSAESLLGRVDDTARAVAGSMDEALEHLERAVADASAEALEDALPAEQDALQGLLALQERERTVARGSAGGAPAGGSRANARSGIARNQLDQLELENRENRYETQSRAGQPGLQAQAARDTREARDRLAELARRQADLNERVRELEAELERARSEAEREEIRRRLKRLQEAQEEVLRDTDALRQDLEQSAASSRLAGERERLDQTRESVRRASEALEDGRLPQALAEGSRAGRELEELERELRDDAGELFDERARDLTREARRLEREQERLARELAEQGDGGARRSLADGGREALEEALERQGEDLGELLDAVEETVLDAETSEPLLAEELYDALERARREGVAEDLAEARELVERGFPRQAEAPEADAREGLGELRRGVERAAESVLGSGVEALERAERELERLAAELGGEVNGRRGGAEPEVAPLTGGDFRDWSERLRHVEEMLDDPDLAAEAARLRGRARTVREDVQRHSREPSWELVDQKIRAPLSALRQRVAEELRRRRAEDRDVPIDRDPVPPEFAEAVRRYYERLGRGR